MAERKVLIKYIPPDFDPSLLPKRQWAAKDGQWKVRAMLPFSVECNRCGGTVYKGTKFNARQEVASEDYLGMKIYRFYIRCTRCSAEITFKTDPKNADYTCENGAKRLFEPWREAKRLEQEWEVEKEKEEKDTMKTLEKRANQYKRELDELDALVSLRERNARLFNATQSGLEKYREKKRKLDEIEDQKLIDEAFGKKKSNG